MKSLSGSGLHLSLRMDSRSTCLHQARDPSFPDAKARRFSVISRPIFSVSSVRSLPPPFRDLVFFFFRSDFTKGLIHGGSLEDIRIDFLGNWIAASLDTYKYNFFTRTLKAENGTLSLLLDQSFVDAFKSAVTNCFNLLHWLYTSVILYIILLYYLFIYLFIIVIYYYCCCFFCFAHSQWWEKIEKRSTDWANPAAVLSSL